MSSDPYHGVTERRLLQSIVEVARHIYGAAAASVFTVDSDSGELIFAAVSGMGEQSLVGTRFPARTGIAGWVVASRQPVIADDVAETDQFAPDAATSTGYVPTTIMAAPLIADDECIGVLEVLDRHTSVAAGAGRDLDDMDLLGLLATQAALGLALLRRQERAARPPANMDALLDRWVSRTPASSVDPLAVTLLAASVDALERRSHAG
jgi:GAF domain-containing protein